MLLLPLLSILLCFLKPLLGMCVVGLDLESVYASEFSALCKVFCLLCDIDVYL